MNNNTNDVPFDIMVQCLTKIFDINFAQAEQLIKSKEFRSKQLGDALWFGFINPQAKGWKGKVVSAYFHPTRQHTAITVATQGKKQSVADPGKWAISMQSIHEKLNSISYSD